VVIPFLLVADATHALRFSNAIATVMLFAAGYRFGISSGRPPWQMGLMMVIVCALLVSLCIALGG
jgi:VIT1/CCC1 family predicted Fe2+/Mn2+ transporter